MKNPPFFENVIGTQNRGLHDEHWKLGIEVKCSKDKTISYRLHKIDYVDSNQDMNACSILLFCICILLVGGGGRWSQLDVVVLTPDYKW